jgi:MFS family permease
MAKFSPVVRRLGWLHFWNDFTLDFLTPILPVGVGVAWIGLMEGLADGVGHVLKVVTGRDSDRRGVRVPFVRSGYQVNAFARPLAAVGLFLAWPVWIVVFRVLDRVGKGIRGSATDALVADWADGPQRDQAYARMRVLDNAGATLGALAAALVTCFWPERIAWAVALLLLPALVVVKLCAGLADRPQVASTNVAATPGWWPKSPVLTLPLAAVALASIGLRLSPLLILVRVAGNGGHPWPLWGSCLAWAALGLVQTASAQVSGGIVARLGPSATLRWSWGVGALVFAGLAWVPSAWLGAVGLGWALLAGATEGAEKAWIGRLAPQEERALAFGALALVSAIGAIVGSGVVGLGLATIGGHAFALPAVALLLGPVAVWTL